MLRPRVHGLVGKPVGLLVLLSTYMTDSHPADLAHHRPGRPVKPLQCLILDFVFAVDLPDEKLGVGADLQVLDRLFDCISQGGKESCVLGHIVRLVSKISVQRGDFLAGFILDIDTEARVPGIPTGAAIDAGDQPVRLRGWGWQVLQR